MSMIKFDDFAKLNFRIGLVKLSGKKLKVLLDEKEFDISTEIHVKDGDKIAVGVVEGGIVIPVVGLSPLTPDADIEAGSKIS
jgi:hypothetical protein